MHEEGWCCSQTHKAPCSTKPVKFPCLWPRARVTNECKVRWPEYVSVMRASWDHLGDGVCCVAQDAKRFEYHWNRHSHLRSRWRSDAGPCDNSPGEFWKHWQRNDTVFTVKREYRKSGVSCRPFAVYSGPRVLLPRSAQLPLGYSIAQVTHPRVLEHIFNPELRMWLFLK
jgi:hypothetical protein